jgi:hypothetical protein
MNQYILHNASSVAVENNFISFDSSIVNVKFGEYALKAHEINYKLSYVDFSTTLDLVNNKYISIVYKFNSDGNKDFIECKLDSEDGSNFLIQIKDTSEYSLNINEI